MPTPILTNDILRVRVCCYTPNQIALNILHFKVTATVGTFNDTDVANQLDLLFAPKYKTLMPPTARYRGVGVSRLSPFPTSEVTQVGSDGPGVTGTEMLPQGVSAIVGFYDGSRGRAHRGRMYPGFISQNYLATDGSPVNSFPVTLATLTATFSPQAVLTVGLNGATLQHSLFHRALGLGTVTPVVNLRYPPKFPNQHRRGAYGKLNVLPF